MLDWNVHRAAPSTPAGSLPFHKLVGRSFDHLAQDQSWTPGKAAALEDNASIRPTRVAAVVACAKNEGPYLLEWVAHHRAAGFGHLFVYSNNNTDGSDDLLDVLAGHGVLTWLRNDCGPDASPQVRAYEHAMLHLPELWEFEWAAFLDLDEFLVPAARHNHSVPALLRALDDAYPGHPPAALRLNWLVYGSSGEVEHRPGLVAERFVHAAPNPLVKTVARLRAVRSMRRIHLPDGPDGAPGAPGWFTVDGSFNPVPAPEPYTNSPACSEGWVSHYFHKSFAEFCVKASRGEGSAPGGRTGKSLDTFIAWDVQPSPGTHRPMPDAMRARTAATLAALHALPGVTDAEAHVADRFGRLLERATGGNAGDMLRRLHQELAHAPAVAPPTVTMTVSADASVPPPANVCRPDLPGENYHAVLQRLHRVLEPQSYLEIGVAAGATLALASCASVAVDPALVIGDGLGSLLDRPAMLFFRMASDEFFARHSPAVLLGAPVDLAFLDGLHHCEALLRDFIHTERFCHPGSVIVLHDCLPVEASIATRTPGQWPALATHRKGWWAGDVWRTARLLKRRRPGLRMVALDSEPTGLVLVTNLAPDNDDLANDYDACVADMLSWDLAEIGLDRLFAELEVEPTRGFSTSVQIRARLAGKLQGHGQGHGQGQAR